MFLDGKKVLVTGGAGFIGSHLAKTLIESGCSVYIADNFSRGRKENIATIIDKIQLYPTDLTKLENCITATKDIDYVFHLAASVGGEERSQKLNEFKEEDAYPANPLTTYGWAKLMGEIQCRAYHLDYGLKTTSVRIFNAYGEHESIDPRWSHVIPSLIRKAIVYPKEGFKMFGDGRQERAFLHVENCVDGLIKSMEKIEDGDPINLGSEELVTIGKLAEKIVNLSGKKIDIEYDLSGPQGTHRYCANTTKMREVLEWSPRVSLDEGLRRTYEWEKGELEKNVEK
jgi:nucleoside-diphosphate-sugar epimerase